MMKNLLIIFAIPIVTFFIFPTLTSAQSTPTVNSAVTNLQSKIDQRTQDIKNLEAEIASYLKQLNELGNQATSLSSTIKSLQLTQKKLEADIKVTENKIIEKNLQIQKLGGEISDKEDNISDNKKIISRSFSMMNELGTKSLPELLLAERSLSNAWNSIDEISTVQQGLFDHISQLQNLKANLEANKLATEKAKAELLTLGKQLNDQKKIVAETTKENNALLKETKNNQANYTKLLATRQQQKEAFEREVSDYEAQLKASVDLSNIPNSGNGVLNYPLDKIKITQYFGNTEFATKKPQVYNGSGHNGIDFAASIGTPIRASLTGTVIGVGNTDLACANVSLGKWIMIRHSNGLSTLYAHLSVQSVAVGQEVITGQVVGYSGNTGYTTGPHLHFGVYVSDGVAISIYNFKSCSGASIKMPVLIKRNAYLNPLLYL